MATLPLFAVLFVPIWLGRHELFVWTDPAEVAKNAALQRQERLPQRGLLRDPRDHLLHRLGRTRDLFFQRSLRSRTNPETSGSRAGFRLSHLPGIIIFSLTVTLAAVDWIMSLEPEWYSTMFGVYYFAGSLLSAFAFIVVAIAFIHSRGLLARRRHDRARPRHRQACFSRSWCSGPTSRSPSTSSSGTRNMPEETTYFMHRSRRGWPSGRQAAGGRPFRDSLLLLDAACHQALGAAAGRGRAVAPRHALHGPLLVCYPGASGRGAHT